MLICNTERIQVRALIVAKIQNGGIKQRRKSKFHIPYSDVMTLIRLITPLPYSFSTTAVSTVNTVKRCAAS